MRKPTDIFPCMPKKRPWRGNQPLVCRPARGFDEYKYDAFRTLGREKFELSHLMQVSDKEA